MGCAKIFTCVCASIVTIVFIVTLSPSIWWSHVSGDNGALHELNLWQNCFSNATVDHSCYTYGTPNPVQDIENANDANSLRDGTIAGVFFAILFAFLTMVCACCSGRCSCGKVGAIILSLLTAICASAAVGSWVEFMQHKGGDWNIDPKEVAQSADVGLAMAATGVVFSWMMAFSSCCIPSATHDKYGQLA